MRRRLAEYVWRNGATQLGLAKTEDPESNLAQQQWRESVWADVAALPSAQSIAVTLRFAEGMSYVSEEVVPVDLSQFSPEERKRIEGVLDDNVPKTYVNL